MTRLRKYSTTQTVVLFAFAAAVSLTTGCHKKQSSLPSSSTASTNTGYAGIAPTATLTADPPAIDLGASTVLNWRTTNATSVTIDGIGAVPLNGTQTVSPVTSTNYHLVARGDGGTTEANVRVTLRAVRSENLQPGGTVMSRDRPSAGRVSDEVFHASVQDIFFDYDSFDLRPDAQTAATQAAAFLVQHPDVKVLIGGYADERGSAEYNLALGESRANSAKTGLVTAGVASARIRVISYGKEKQFCTEANEACWQENRRAQFSIDR